MTGRERPARAGWAAGLLISLSGCYTGLGPDSVDSAGLGDTGSVDGGESDDGDDDGPPSAPTDTVPVQSVPDDLPTTNADGFCVTPTAGQSVVGVSPDGFAWLAMPMAGESDDARIRFEVVDPWTGDITVAPNDVELGGMVDIKPRSSEDAVVVTADGLWHLDAWSRVELVPPSGFTGSASACGNPRDDGFVLASGTLYERRPDAWWGLAVPGIDSGIPDRIIAFDGECLGPDDETWMSSPDGTVWRVSIDGVVRGLRFDGFAGAAATGSSLAVLAADELWVGPGDWARWGFAVGDPELVAASDDTVWLSIGERVLRHVDGDFTELAAPGDGHVDQLFAHPGGVWIARDDETLCHAAVGPQLRVEGVLPYQRTSDHEVGFSVSLKETGVTVDATLDGEPVSLAGGATLERSGLIVPEGLGWHRLELVAQGAGGETSRRTLWLRRKVPEQVSFAADVAPIALEHCSGAACHTAMTTAGIPVLETLEAWTQHIDNIEARVVELDNMPPPGARSPSWGSDEVETIAKWIEGGMLP